MISFAPSRPRRQMGEPVVPMINIVFLLLIFFLMTAAIAPPDPLDLNLPETQAEAAELPRDVLYIAADGTMAFEDARGSEVFGALSARDNSVVLSVRADAAFPAAELAGLLPRFAALGVREIELLTVAP